MKDIVPGVEDPTAQSKYILLLIGKICSSWFLGLTNLGGMMVQLRRNVDLALDTSLINYVLKRTADATQCG